MNLRVRAGFLCGAVALALSPPCRASDFSPQTVFDLSAHTMIDERCREAREFAKTAAAGTDSIAPDAAFAAAKEFVACLKLPNVHPDPDKQRYLMLAAAASLYIAGTKTTGQTSIDLLKASEMIAGRLAARPSDRTNGLKDFHYDPTDRSNSASVEQQVGERMTNNNGDNRAQQMVETHTYSNVRDPHGGGQPLPFTEVADNLRASIESRLSSPAPQPSATVMFAYQGGGQAPRAPAQP
jgi:hypothetical protein